MYIYIYTHVIYTWYCFVIISFARFDTVARTRFSLALLDWASAAQGFERSLAVSEVKQRRAGMRCELLFYSYLFYPIAIVTTVRDIMF